MHRKISENPLVIEEHFTFEMKSFQASPRKSASGGFLLIIIPNYSEKTIITIFHNIN